jgi:hypothetical protein
VLDRPCLVGPYKINLFARSSANALAEVAAVAEHDIAQHEQAPPIPKASIAALIGQPERGGSVRCPPRSKLLAKYHRSD